MNITYNTPVQAIRKECLDCSKNQPKEVRLCPVTTCHLWSMRLKRRPKGSSPLKAIRANCLNCNAGSTKAVKKCPIISCYLYLYRFGKSLKKSQ